MLCRKVYLNRPILKPSYHIYVQQLVRRRPDIMEGLKRLKCGTLIFLGDSSPFHSEALHMTSKLARRYTALVEVRGIIVNACTHVMQN